MYKKEFIAKDGTQVLFREPKKTDAKLAMNYINQLAKERDIQINVNKKVKLKDEQDWLNGVLKKIRKNVRVHLFAEINHQIVGGCEITRQVYRQGHRGIFGIALAKKARGKGIGKALAKEVISLAKKRMKGLEQIELDVHATNKIAKELYQKLGFQKVAIIPKKVKNGNKYCDSEVRVLWIT